MAAPPGARSFGCVEVPQLHLPALHPRAAEHPETWAVQLRWYAIAVAVGFVAPWLGSSLLGLQHDLYLGLYFTAVVALFATYAAATQLDLRATLARRWRLGAAIAVVLGVVLVRNVLSDGATARPHGAYFVFELVWRGGFYGAIDALLLTVLPCLVAYRALGGRLTSWRRRLAYFASALVLVMTITAVYHLGFAQYRQDGVGAPETGNALISVPMLLTTNPIGSVADHAAMHIAAVAHTYETTVRLPPPASAD
jgi:hypothetical protein